MTSPLILPSMLINLAPLGIDWESIPIQGASSSQNFAALLDICYIASDAIDTECFQPLRSTVDVEELTGPNQRLTIENQTGVGTALMQHWPITDVLGAQWAATAQFPPSWQPIPPTSLLLREPSAQFVGSSFLGSSGADGMNGIDIEPGYVTWWNGRSGCRVQIAYQNGWPTAGLLPAVETTGTLAAGSETVAVVSTAGIVAGAPISCRDYIPDGTTVLTVGSGEITISQQATQALSNAPLQIGYGVGVSVLNVDDVTGMAGTRPTIFDGATSEGIQVISAVATSPVTVLPGIVAQVGPGTITLASPTRRAHSGTDPASALVSAMPSNVRLAGYYYAGDQALVRGTTAITVPALPGSMQGTGGTVAIGNLTKMAQNQLMPFKRIF